MEEQIYYTPFSKQRAELRKIWNTLNCPDNPIDWEDYLNEAESKIDLLEHHDKLPASVQVILVKFSDQDNDYETCSKLVDDLNVVGFTIDYGLDAEPYNLRRLTMDNFK